MRWPWKRPHPASPDPLAFDALIDLPATRIADCATVADAVRSMPGAHWVDVQALPKTITLAARVFPRGSSVVPETPEWRTLRNQVEQQCRSALAALAAQAAPDSAPDFAPDFAPEFASHFVPHFAPHFAPGFAESLAPNPLAALEALEALESLATSMRYQPEPLPDPPPAAPRQDPQALHRLLALVLPADATPVATRALARFGSYPAVLAAPEIELRRVPGLGTHSIAAIKLMHEAALRLARARVAARPVLDDPGRLADYLAAALARHPIEQFRILFLDPKGMLLADELQAAGTVNHTPVYPREVVRRAIEHRAAAIILVHNHPSGDPSPSQQDLAMTAQVRRAATIMGIGLQDHVIVGNGRWLSFRAAGLLDA